jgi:streptogramin lyase
VRRFTLPAAGECDLGTHASGIAFDRSRHVLWLDNALTSEVASFDPSSGTFNLVQLGACNAHPHDGLVVGSGGVVWFDEEFANGIGKLTP